MIRQDSGATVVFVEGRRELETVRHAAGAAPMLAEVVVIDVSGAELVPVMRSVGDPVRVTSYVDAIRVGRDRVERRDGHALVRDRVDRVMPESVATLAYTSGTTGPPRGVMLAHSNFAFELDAILDAMTIGPDDEQLLVLPLAHILGRILAFGAILSGSKLAFGEGPHRFVENAGDVRPTFFGAVPRLFEKVFAVATDSAKSEGPLKSALFAWAVGVGHQRSRAHQKGKPLRGVSAARARYADALVLRRFRNDRGSEKGRHRDGGRLQRRHRT